MTISFRQNQVISLRILLFLSFFFLVATTVRGEYCFRIWLKDKSGSTGLLDNPQVFLSQKALSRRAKFGLAIDSADLPVSSVYLQKINSIGGKYRCQSRWANTVTISSDRLEIGDEYRALSFVDSVHCVKNSTVPFSRLPKAADKRRSLGNETIVSEASYYGNGWSQINQLNGHLVHERGFKGAGVTIAVIDGGFEGALKNPFLKSTSIVGTRNFVRSDATVFAEDYHGAAVLSIMASEGKNQMVGTAPEASYWLLNSEDGNSEYPVEEDYLAAAIEYADSLGVDIVNISLGYTAFDDPSMNHHYSEFENPFLFLQRVTYQAARKGLLIVNAAGNDRTDPWRKISFPAHSTDVLTVGAVDIEGRASYFTSEGWVSELSVKPNVSALGVATSFVFSDGSLKQGNGTSFSSPVICGMVACMMQAFPLVKPDRWIDQMGLFSSQSSSPNNLVGYGIPDFNRLFISMSSPDNIIENKRKEMPIKYLVAERRLVWDESLDLFQNRCVLFDAKGVITQASSSLDLIDTKKLNSGVYSLHVYTSTDRFIVRIVL